jgi:hypothetical protein
MQPFEVPKTNDFAVYKQVLRGAYNPVSIAKSAVKSVISLVRSANSCVVCSADSKDEVTRFVSTSNLTAYGYHSTNDFKIIYKHDPKLKVHLAIIEPSVVYPLNEDISLPSTPDEKAKLFMDFFADEFERVKIRAEYLMDGSLSDELLRSCAMRNLQILRKLYHDSRISFNSMCSRSNTTAHQSDLFIMYVLNLFIIRSVVFYSKFFKPLLKEEPPSEVDLRNNFHQEMPHILKYPWLFGHRPPLYEILGDFANSSQLNDGNSVYQKANDLTKHDVPDSLLKAALDLIQYKGAAKLNCNTNIPVTAFYEMLHLKNENGQPLLEADASTIAKFFSFFFTDKNGEPVNATYVNAILKPSNFSKRPNKDDMSKSIFKNLF